MNKIIKITSLILVIALFSTFALGSSGGKGKITIDGRTMKLYGDFYDIIDNEVAASQYYMKTCTVVDEVDRIERGYNGFDVCIRTFDAAYIDATDFDVSFLKSGDKIEVTGTLAPGSNHNHIIVMMTTSIVKK